MKRFAHIICCLAALGAASCNDEVFVEDFLPQAPTVVLSESRSSAAVDFEAGNWDVAGVSDDFSRIIGRVYDLEGNDLGYDYGSKGLARICFELDGLAFRIERSAPDRLELTLVENLRGEPVQLKVEVGNEFETEHIPLTLQPTSRYRIDSVEYGWEGFSSQDNMLELADRFTVDNSSGTEAVTIIVTPYRDAARTISFYSSDGHDESDFRRWFGEPLPGITIPDIRDGKPVPDGPEVQFGIQQQRLDCGLDPEYSESVEIPAGLVREVHVYLETEEYSVPYSIHAVNPFNGREMTFSGELRSSRPYGCLIIPLEPAEP